MKFFLEERLLLYGCGSVGRSCDWKGFGGGVIVFTFTELESTFDT